MKKYRLLLLVLIVTVLPLLSLWGNGLPITHDGQDHVARIANFYQNLSEGVLVPRWAGNLNWGYGHPILMFLYPLPSYMASLFHLFGFSFVDSVKLVFASAYILSAVTMYLFVKELFDNEDAGVLASLLYVITPYRFVDLYVRGAIGEHVAFIFPPLILFFLLKIYKQYSSWYVVGGALALAGFILSHNAISLMFLPLILLFAIYLYFQTSQKKMFSFHTFLVISFGFSLAAFFWLPAFMEGKYTLRDIVTGGGEYATRFVPWQDFFYGPWSYGGTVALSKQIGILHWIVVIGSFVATYVLYRKKNRLWMISKASFAIFWITLFIMTAMANPIWQTITTLQKFQFPWRFLSVTVFLSALLGGFVIYVLPKQHRKIAVIVSIVVLLFLNKDYWYTNGFLQKPESFYTSIYNGTTDTGESAPIWSIRFMEKRPNAPIEVIDGKATIQLLKRTTTEHTYKIEVEEFSRMKENTLYFPGWEVYANEKRLITQFQDPNHRGLMTFVLPKGTYTLRVVFEETKLRLLANILSVTSLFVLFTYGITSGMVGKKSKAMKGKKH